MSAPDISKGIGGIMVRGTIMMAAMRWGMRLTGFASVVVLARLLAPEDFGIVAMAAALMGLLEGFVNFGVDLALIQNREAGRKEYDTAWTIRLGQTVLVSGALLAIAPWAGAFYDEPRVEPVVWALAALMLLRGFENIGVVDFRRDLRFGREFVYRFASKISRAVFAIGFAFAIESHWALVLGMLGGTLTTLILSYVMSPYRPRLSLAAFKALWSFSQWMLVLNISQVLGAQGGRFLVGGYAPAAVMGAYTVGTELAAMPTLELRAPVQHTIGPGLARIKENRPRAVNAGLRSMAMMALLVCPAGFGVFAVADELVRVILGAKWAAAVPFVEAGAFMGTWVALATIPTVFLQVCGHIRRAALIRAGSTAAMLASAYPVLQVYDVTGFAYIQAGLAFLSLVVFIQQMSVTGGSPIASMLRPLLRPLLAAAIMAAGVRWLTQSLALSPFATLPIAVAAGATIYTAVALGLWAASGRPDGAEDDLVKAIMSRGSVASVEGGLKD